MVQDYPRMSGFAPPGFAAGPCLFKDTMQLAAFSNNSFFLGHAAMLVNEGLPNYLVRCLKRRLDLSKQTVGILGMAFKAESDDVRSSLSYKLKRILRFKAARVLTTDPYVQNDADLVPVEELVAECDLLIVGTPHERYRGITTDKPIIDIWNLFERGVQV
jgi:UDP-N-acetyl-D-mannosaminuronic acid dehydrogenase